MIVSCTIIFGFVLLSLIYSTTKPYNFPPGPKWFPILGNVLHVQRISKLFNGQQHLALWEMAKTFKTNVLGLKLGNTLVVTVFSPTLVKSVLTNEVYDGRPQNFFSKIRTVETNKGITFTDGKFCMEQKTFVTRQLRNKGFGKRGMLDKIQDEVYELRNEIELNFEEVHINRLIAHAVLNVLWQFMASIRFSRDDKELNEILDIAVARTKTSDISGGLLSQHPWLRHLAPEKTGYNSLLRLNQKLRRFFTNLIDEHHETWIAGQNEDLIYSFISEMERSNGNSSFTPDQLLMVCIDLFTAGSQRSSNTLEYAFLLMLLYPDVQAKVQAVLDEAFDDKHVINYEDRYKVPYVEAVLSETERFCGVAPILGPRRVLKDTVLEGYNIPKDTLVMIHAHSVHMDKETWGDPEVFRPERFLNAENKLITSDLLLPFGLGKRKCVGEPLARSCIFIFFTEIVRNYKILPLSEDELPSIEPHFGFILTPQDYGARYIKRRL